MGTWQDGYVIDVPYVAGFYRELSPAYLNLVAVFLGVQPPAVLDKEFAYCELGCGWGMGPLLLAATNPLGTFHGYDFNPTHIARARGLAERAGIKNVRFGEETFADLAAASAAPDAPRFDLIVLHGVYSWVSAENRRHIVRFIRDRLNPGGMVYVSYNCMPGWAALAPLQRLLRELVLRRRGRNDENAVIAVDFVKELAARGAHYFKANEQVARYVEHLAAKDGAYLAHEYLNEHWDALYHLDVAREMEEAHLEYVGSATISENIDALAASPAISEMFGGADQRMVETLKDFAGDRRFRRDLFVREPQRLSGPRFVEALGRIRITLAIPPELTTTTLETSAGKVSSGDPIIGPILERLKQGSVGVAELAALPALAGLSQPQFAQALSLLVESSQAHPMLERTAGQAPSQALNAVLLEAAGESDLMRFLAAPLLGSGVFVSPPEQLVLLALREVGSEDVAAIRDAVWAQFKAQKKRLAKDGHAIDGEAANLAELERRIRSFLVERLPLLRRLGAAGEAGSA